MRLVLGKLVVEKMFGGGKRWSYVFLYNSCGNPEKLDENETPPDLTIMVQGESKH